MPKSKLKSFTLAELVVVMLITAIIVGMAFSVFRLVQKQIHTIQKNLDKTSTLALFEQQLWQDFNQYNTADFYVKDNQVQFKSEKDSVRYLFKEDLVLRNQDTIPLKLNIIKVLFQGKQEQEGTIDAISITATQEVPNYTIFVSKKNDITYFMNQDGF